MWQWAFYFKYVILIPAYKVWVFLLSLFTHEKNWGMEKFSYFINTDEGKMSHRQKHDSDIGNLASELKFLTSMLNCLQ